jgi:hypothetical protein
MGALRRWSEMKHFLIRSKFGNVKHIAESARLAGYDFPVQDDMLRYDQFVECSRFDDDHFIVEAERCTPERWSSFGWIVEDIPCQHCGEKAVEQVNFGFIDDPHLIWVCAKHGAERKQQLAELTKMDEDFRQEVNDHWNEIDPRLLRDWGSIPRRD